MLFRNKGKYPWSKSEENIPATQVNYLEPYQNRDGVLWYPGVDPEESTIKVEMYDTRAADDLIIGYDYDRDGYVISRGEDPDTEVAFVRSWAEFEESNDA